LRGNRHRGPFAIDTLHHFAAHGASFPRDVYTMRVFECSVAVFTTLMTSALLSAPAPRSYGASR